MNFSAYGLESSRTPSYVNSTFGQVRVSSGPVTAQDGTTTEYVTKKGTKVTEEQGVQEVTAAVKEQAYEEKQEQKLVAAEAVVDE